MENYYENPKYCKKCGKVIPFEKRENSFCNRSCANSYSNSIRVLSEETKKKIANSLKKDKNKAFSSWVRCTSIIVLCTFGFN